MQRDPKEQPQGRPLLVAGAVAAVVIVCLVWWQWDAIRTVFASDEPAEPAPVETVADENEAAPPVDSAAPAAALVWPGDLDAPGDCADVEAELARICATLDSREYLGETGSVGGSCALLSEVTVALAQRPPDPSLELRSYETILANVFHMFRVAGRERMDVLRRALRAEQELAEPLALALYRWAASRENCARSGDTPIRQETLYAYAGFLFQTMGGQAYLRRRSPRVEALASFYALLILDQAERDGRNPLGFDVLPEIGRTRELIDAQAFVFGERYLERLSEMEHRRATPDP